MKKKSNNFKWFTSKGSIATADGSNLDACESLETFICTNVENCNLPEPDKREHFSLAKHKVSLKSDKSEFTDKLPPLNVAAKCNINLFNYNSLWHHNDLISRMFLKSAAN